MTLKGNVMAAGKTRVRILISLLGSGCTRARSASLVADTFRYLGRTDSAARRYASISVTHKTGTTPNVPVLTFLVKRIEPDDALSAGSSEPVGGKVLAVYRMNRANPDL